MDERTKEGRTPGRKGGDEGWIGQRQLEKDTEKSTLGGAAEAGKVRGEENMNICAPLLSLLKGMRDLVALSHEILSVKSLGGS